MVPQLNLPECDGAWQAVAGNRFMELWSSQLSKLPLQSSVHMNSVVASVRFGTFYLTDISDKLPETSLTMSIGELEEAMVKHRRNRKTCWRGPPEFNPPARAA